MLVVWVVLALALLAVEMHHVAFYALFGAIGAGVAATVAVVAPGAVALQAAAALCSTALGVMLVRPYVSRAFGQRHHGRVAVGVHGGLIGERVIVLDTVSGRPGGHVRLAGEVWLATSGTDDLIPAGASAIVSGVTGTTLTVLAVEDHHPPRSLSPSEGSPS